MLIVVQGASATGKTTLSQRLASDLDIGLLAKDDIKELLMDKLGLPEDIDRSAVYGRAAIRAFYDIVDEWLRSDINRHLILESAFITDFAVEDFENIEKYNVPMLQIYVKVDAGIRRERLIERNRNGTRHKGHLETERLEVYEESFADNYRPLAIERTIVVDTSDFDDKKYTTLLNDIKGEI